MSTVLLSLRMLYRDWHSGELRVLALALMLAVASVTSVGFFTDRIQRALEQQSNELLGGDIVVKSSNRVSDAVKAVVRSFDVRSARTVEFPSMVIAADKSHLASLKGVSESYPLRGELRITTRMFSTDAPAQGVPTPGTVWLESRLLNQLGINVGDRITLGDAEFVVSAIITNEPARASGSLFSLAPRVMLNIHDLERTGLIQPASRVRYRQLFAGDIDTITRLRKAISKQLQPGERLEGVEDAQPGVRRALDRSQRFLGLAALVSVLLAGVAVATSTRRFVARHLDSCAMMRCMGATQSEILFTFMLQLAWLCLIAGVTGCLLGYLLQYGLVAILATVIDIVLPQPSYIPIIIGLLVGVVTLSGFALPPLMHLKHVPPLRVIRRELGDVPARSVVTYLVGSMALFVLILIQAHDIKLGVYMLGGVIAAMGLFYIMAVAVLRILQRFKHHGGIVWRFGVGNITRRTRGSILQVMAFGLGIMVLLLLTLVRDDLLHEWETNLPEDAPNRFLINIQPDQRVEVEDFFVQQGLPAPSLFPMVRGRLTAIDGRALSLDSYEDDRASRLVAREFNLSWSTELQEDNIISAGQWWPDQSNGKKILSVEKGLAETLGIELGDNLTFSIADDDFTARVTSLREVDWDSFRVNFFVLAPPGVLDSYPATYITSLYLPASNGNVLNELVKSFPNITVIDVAAVMRQVRTIIERVTLAVEYVFVFTLLAGVLVMYAAIHSTLDERIQESAILRTLGADRSLLLKGTITEFAGLGLLSGLVAAFAATVSGYILAHFVFHLDYAFDGRLWLIGIILGTVGVCAAGLLGTMQVLRRPPLQSLREML